MGHSDRADAPRARRNGRRRVGTGTRSPLVGGTRAGLVCGRPALLGSARRAGGFGDFWQHCLVAEGAVDVAIDAVGIKPYDLAAVKVIVEEAGGTFTDREGVATYEHDTAISSNGLLHAAVLAA